VHINNKTTGEVAMRLYVSEIYEKIEKAANEDEIKNILVENRNNNDLMRALYLTFDPAVKFNVKVPEYKKLNGPADYSIMGMNEAIRKSYIFIEGHPQASPNITEKQRVNLLIQILESLVEDEAKVYEGIITKKAGPKNLTYNVVKSTFPDLVA
jgi:hypothetical protein